MVDDEASQQHPPAVMMAPTAKLSPPFIHRPAMPDIRPICALADAAEAVSRVADNSGIAHTNDNDNAAILASLSTVSLLPHRGGNGVSPTAQLLLDKSTSSFDSNNSTKRYKKKLCSVPTCTNRSVKGGVCVAHGARRHICQMEGCNKVIKIGSYCLDHVRGGDIPGCSMFTVHGEKCSMHGTSRPICKYNDQYYGGCTNVAYIKGYCQLHHLEVPGGNEENLGKTNILSPRDSNALSRMDRRCEEDGKRSRSGLMQLTSSLDLLCSVTFQSLKEGAEVVKVDEVASKLPESHDSKHQQAKGRLIKCGICEACVRDDCGECKPCLDKPKFGGRNTMRRRCCKRQCLDAKHKLDTDAVVEEVEVEKYDEAEARDYEEVEEAEDVETHLPQSHVSKPRRIDRRGGNCGSCEACLREDCGECKSCLDKLKFGGLNKMKRKCCKRSCANKRNRLDQESISDGNNGLCLSSRLDSKAFVDKVKTTMLAGDICCSSRRDFVDRVKTNCDDSKSEEKRMKAELAKIKAELDAKANGKKYGLKPPEYPTFNYSATDGDEDDYLSSDEELMNSNSSGQSSCIVSSSGVERGVTIRPSGKWQVQLYYAGASRYIGLFGSREEACTAYKVARECMHSFSCLDPSPEQIVRNLDILRKAAISKAEIGVDHVGRSDQCAELQKRDVKPNGEITKLKSKGESCSLDRRLQVVATSASGRTNSGRTAALHVESRNRPEFVSSKTAGRSKYEAGSVEESSSTKNGARSPSRPKTLFTKEGPMEVDAASRSPIRSRPLLIMQPKEKTVEDGISLGDEVQNESTENGQTRTSMSIIYQKAMSMELPRGITVRPSGKWQVQLYYGGKSRYLGVFKSKLDAAVAYELARERCSSFQRDPSPEQVVKNVSLIRKAAFTVKTGGLQSASIGNKKQKTN